MKQVNAGSVATFSGLMFAVLFVVLGGISHGYAARNVVFLAVIGALIGFLAPYWLKHTQVP